MKTKTFELSTVQILEMNKLIADFDEFEFIIPDNEFGEPPIPFPIDKLKYDSSYEWIMPVIEKIEKLGFKVLIGFDTYCGIIKNQKLIDESTLKFESTELVSEPSKSYTKSADTKIHGVYLAVIKFVKWYNDQKK